MTNAAESGAPVWVLPAEPLTVRLVNTVWADARGVHDSLGTPQDLAAWLAETGLGAVRVGLAELEQFRALRDALRRLAAWVTEDPRTATPDPLDLERAVAVVNAATRAAVTGPRLHLRGPRLVSDDTPADAAAALATVAGRAVRQLSERDLGAPLRACLAPRCVLYFVKDHPRRSWCSPACGNRARAARHYRRHRPERADGPP